MRWSTTTILFVASEALLLQSVTRRTMMSSAVMFLPISGENVTRGLTASAVRTGVRVASYPLETLKTRQQTGAAAGPVFSGVGVAVLQVPASAVVVTTFDVLRRDLDRSTAALLASLPPLVLKIPLEGLKQRRQIDRPGELSYRGGDAHALRELGFNFVQLAIYDALDLSPPLAGGLAALIAAIFTHPIDVLKTNAMTSDDDAKSLSERAQDLVRKEGIGIFLKGLVPRALHATLGGAAFFAVKDLR